MLRIFLLLLGLCLPVFSSSGEFANCDSSREKHLCSPNSAFAGTVAFDFTNTANWTHCWSKDSSYSKEKRIVAAEEGKGTAFSISESAYTAILSSNQYLFFGKVSAQVQAASGQGVVTTIVLKSDSGNEIEWEILGAYDNEAQTNYFFQGDPLYNTYNHTYDIGSSVSSESHTYAVEWTQNKIVFSIDGTERKIWYVGDLPPEKWPQSPMKVHIGIWAVNADNTSPGEMEWAGGAPDWNRAPFKAYFNEVSIDDYTGWCEEVHGPVSYTFDENMHTWEDVKVQGCEKRLSSGMYTPHVPVSQPAETGPSSPGKSDLPTGAEATGTEEPTSETSVDGEAEGTQGGDTEKGGAEVVAWPCSSRLAAVVFLVWAFIV